MVKLTVHRVAFYHPKPASINCLSFDVQSERLAVSRSDQTLEIWTLKNKKLFREKVFPCLSNGSIEALAWFNGEVVTGGQNGELRRYDVHCWEPVQKFPLSPSPVWALASNHGSTKIAVGVENGSILLAAPRTKNRDLKYVKSRMKCLERVLSLCWSPDDGLLASGSVDAILVWRVESQTCLHRLAVVREERKTPSLVWCLTMPSNDVLASGDSRGFTTFWDVRLGTALNAYQSHKADVLAMVHSEKEGLFASGVEPTLIQFVSVASSSSAVGHKQVLDDPSYLNGVWTEAVKRYLHSHDVRDVEMVPGPDWLVSGGVDTFIGLSRYPPNESHLVPPFNKDQFSLSSAKCLLLIRYADYLDLWKLGSTEDSVDENPDRSLLEVSQNPILLARIKSKGGTFVRSATIAHNGDYLVYSNQAGCHILRISEIEPSHCNSPPAISLQRTELINGQIPPCSLVRIGAESDHLVAISDAVPTVCYKVALDGTLGKIQSEQRLDFIPQKSCVSSCGNYMGLSSEANVIHVINLVTFEEHCRIPKSNCRPLDIHIRDSAGQPSLIALFSDHSVIEYDLLNQCYTARSNSHLSDEVPKVLAGKFSNFDGLALPHQDASSPLNGTVLLYSNDELVFVDPSRKPENNSKLWNRRTSGFKYVCFAGFVQDNQLVVVQVEHSRYVAGLPPTLKLKKYGTG